MNRTSSAVEGAVVADAKSGVRETETFLGIP
jgi:hypothetical protein